MLRIRTEETRKRSGRRVRLMLEGKLVGPWVEELEKTWNRVREEPVAAIRVDLCAVTSISQAGETLLRRLEAKGAELRPGSLWMRAWMAEMRRSAALPLLLTGLLVTSIGDGQQALRIEQTPHITEARLPVPKGSRRWLSANTSLPFKPDPFTESGPDNVEIEASLPSLAKRAACW